MTSTKHELDALSGTALVPFWCRAQDAALPKPLLGDLTAATLAPQVARRFGRSTVPSVTRIGCCLRNRTVDEWLKELASNGQLDTVVELGVGLDTRWHRQPSLANRFVEVDSPEIIDLRAAWLPDSGATRVSGDAMHVATWIGAGDIRIPNRTAVILEGVLAYQSAGKVKRFLHSLAEHLPGAYIIFDSLSPIAAGAANRMSARTGGRPRYTWSTWSTARLVERPRRWQVLREVGFMDLQRELVSSFSRRERLVYSTPVLRRAYRLSLARLPDVR